MPNSEKACSPLLRPDLMPASVSRDLKLWIRSRIPNSLWQWIRGQDLIFGLLFTLFVRRFRAEGLSFIYPKHLIPVAQRALFFFGTYEGGERKFLLRHLQPEDSVLELGGCLGVISCIANSRLSDPTRQLVVEANPYLLPYLYQNRLRNGAQFRVLQAAVGKGPLISFAIESNVHTSGVRTGDGESPAEMLTVPAFTLAEMVARFGPFSVLIIDIEGAEFEIVRQEPEIFRSFRLIVIEVHPHAASPQAVTDLNEGLLAQGFALSESWETVQVWVRSDLSSRSQTAPAL